MGGPAPRGCVICATGIGAAGGAGWTVRELAETFVFSGQHTARPGWYVLCPDCSPLVDAGRCGALAWRTPHRHDAPGPDVVAFLLGLIDRLGPPRPLAAYAAQLRDL